MSEVGQKIINAMREVAEEQPNHTVEQCTYVQPSNVDLEEGCGSCIVGVAIVDKLQLIDAEWFLKQYNSVDVGNNDSNFELVADRLREEFKIQLDGTEILWIATAQKVQDKRYRIGFDEKKNRSIYADPEWGNAVTVADKQWGEKL